MLVSYELILTNAKKYTVENSMYCYICYMVWKWMQQYQTKDYVDALLEQWSV